MSQQKRNDYGIEIRAESRRVRDIKRRNRRTFPNRDLSTDSDDFILNYYSSDENTDNH